MASPTMCQKNPAYTAQWGKERVFDLDDSLQMFRKLCLSVGWFVNAPRSRQEGGVATALVPGDFVGGERERSPNKCWGNTALLSAKLHEALPLVSVSRSGYGYG